MAVEIVERMTYDQGAEVSWEISSKDGEKPLSPGATVARGTHWPALDPDRLEVTVSWWSSGSNDKSIAVAEAMVAVMTRAVELAKTLEQEAVEAEAISS